MDDRMLQPVEPTPPSEREIVEEHADAIARIAIAHLRIAYPAALKAVPRTAQISLAGVIRNAVKARFLPERP